MSTNNAQYPAAVYDGIGPNRTLRTQNSAPDFEDYDQLVAEVIAVQQQQLDDREFIVVNDDGGALIVGSVVYMKTTGKVAKADGDGAAALRIPVGIVKIGAAADGDNCTVQYNGLLVLTAAEWDAVGLTSAGLVVGASYYLGDTAGEITATALATGGDTLFKIGTAVSVTTLMVRLDDEGLAV